MAKKTSKNQITLPRSVVERFPGVSYFEVREEDGRIILRPVRPNAADEVRRKLAALKIQERDIAAAVRWARKR
ncbi:MAG: AbrB/MazE/SpoVT family DNA-binding domain-containing protein [Gemmatimonadetes bacterium]|nr:AbrB/MazE/SpoVT family DNA-binding domain-containing protein [Gemmatimonadota bacterium]MBI2403992.1 AbrB/MazE/SpoVT family DNA-binding domain-containing protein [Gemmatimonadota bacterium]